MVQIARPVGAVTFAAAAVSSAPSQAQDFGQPEKGLTLAKQVCSECHAIDKQSAASPNAAAPRFEAVANVPGITVLALTVALQTPHRAMPNLMLDPDEIRNVAAYIISLK
jgi:cytochrome c